MLVIAGEEKDGQEKIGVPTESELKDKKVIYSNEGKMFMKSGNSFADVSKSVEDFAAIDKQLFGEGFDENGEKEMSDEERKRAWSDFYASRTAEIEQSEIYGLIHGREKTPVKSNG